MIIEEKLNESKRRNNLVSDINSNWQYAIQIMPQILNNSNQTTDEFKALCKFLYKICDEIEINIKELKSIIPFSNS